MTRRQAVVAIAAAAIALHAPGVCADPIHVTVPSTLTTETGTVLQLPPSYILDEPDWDRLDLEVRHLQDDKTRLEAENKVLRDSVHGWQPGWKTLLTTLVVGFAGGVYVAERWF